MIDASWSGMAPSVISRMRFRTGAIGHRPAKPSVMVSVELVVITRRRIY